VNMTARTYPRTQFILFFAYAVILLGGVTAFAPPQWGSRYTSFADSRVYRNTANNDEFDCSDTDGTDENRRRTLLSFGLIPAVTIAGGKAAEAARSSFLVTKKNTTTAETFRKDPVDVETPSLSSELCLIRLLPVKNPVWQTLASTIQSISSLRSESE